MIREIKFDFSVNGLHFCGNMPLSSVLTGDSGSGKSTFLKSLVGIYKWQGSIKLDNASIRPSYYRLIRSKKIAYLPQEVDFSSVRVKEEVEWFKRCAPLFSEERFAELSERLGVSSLLEKGWDEVSGGEKRRLALALVLALKRDLYLLDEPFTGLDEGNVDVVSEIIKDYLCDASFLVVSHLEVVRKLGFEVVSVEKILCRGSD